MKLITELSTNISPLYETKDEKKNLFIEGIFLQSEVKNRNGRIYPRSIMENAVKKYLIEKVETGSAFGELQHGPTPQINADRVSHLITELKFNGNDVYGKAKIGGPKGDDVKKLMELGGRIGVSSRGLGSLKENSQGILEVQNDFYLATAADIVLDPSAPSAFVKGIMEGVEWSYHSDKDTWIANKVDVFENKVKKLSKRQLEEKALNIFKYYLTELTKNK